MASLMKLSAEQLRLARKAGFKRKAPKKPKQSASLATMEGYVARHNQWVKDAKSRIAGEKRREKLKKQIRG